MTKDQRLNAEKIARLTAENAQQSIPAKIVKRIALFAALLTIVQGVVHLFINTKAALRFPSSGEGFIADVNKEDYRLSAFTLSPDFFADHWTPFLMGLFALGQHMSAFYVNFIMNNFSRYMMFLMFVAMYGNLGYCGGLGILFGIVHIILAALCLLISLKGEPGNASLLLGSINICTMFCCRKEKKQKSKRSNRSKQHEVDNDHDSRRREAKNLVDSDDSMV